MAKKLEKPKEKTKEGSKDQEEKPEEGSKDQEEKEPETLDEFVESKEFIKPEPVSRPINLTLSSEQRAQTSSWQAPTEESLEESLQDAPTKPEEEEPEEPYHSGTPEEEQPYTLETDQSPTGREMIETQRVTATGLMERPTTIRTQGTRTLGMIRAPEFQQMPMTHEGEEDTHSYKIGQNPAHKNEMAAFRETAEDIVRKYK